MVWERDGAAVNFTYYPKKNAAIFPPFEIQEPTCLSDQSALKKETKMP